MSEQRTVVGTCSAVEQKPGSEWMRFLVEVQGNNYPLRLDTRDEDVIKKARDAGAQVATWTINEKESDKINPRSNKPYINRYLEGVVLGGEPGFDSSKTSGASSGGGSGQYTQEDIDRFDEKDRRDFRSRAWAQTLATFDHTVKDDEDPMLVFARLKPFQRKLYEDIVQGLAQEPAATGGDSPLSPADDDIPFS